MARYRRGFRDLSQHAELDMMTAGALLVGGRETPVLVVQAGTPEPRGRGRMDVQLRVAVPVDWVTILPVESRYSADLEMRIAVEDDRGRQAQLLTVPLQLNSSQPPVAGSALHHQTSLRLRRRPHRLVVTIHDQLGDRLLIGRVDVTAGAK